MTKYDEQLKLKVVKEYLENGGGVHLAGKYHISSPRLIREWAKQYETLGRAGLKKTAQNQSYSPTFKKNAIELYLKGPLSYQEVSLQLGIPNKSLLANWVSAYRKNNQQLPKARKRGRPAKENILKNNFKGSSDEIPKTRAELEQENLELRAELAYIKALRSLSEKEQADKKQKSLTSSDKTSPSQPS